MLETLSVRPRICDQIRSGPLGRWVDDFVDVLMTRGYATGTVRACRRMSSATLPAMHLLQAGVDMATIALWLGHERLETTHQYVEADLQLKEDALRKLEPLGQRTPRFKADSSLLAFLASL